MKLVTYICDICKADFSPNSLQEIQFDITGLSNDFINWIKKLNINDYHYECALELQTDCMHYINCKLDGED